MSAKKKQSIASGADATTEKVGSDEGNSKRRSKVEIAEDHLVPLPLVFTILVCSGCLWVLGLRDMTATGRVVLGEMDESFLKFTNSMAWYNDSQGWKSTRGGLSAIVAVTTDSNNMGGLFVRKVSGAALMALQMHKLLPVLFHPFKAQWKRGHFRPLLTTSILANLFLAAFYGTYLEDFALAKANLLPQIIMTLLIVETITMMAHLIRQRTISRGPAVAMRDGKTPTSVVSRILSRTVAIVSTLMIIIAGRDLFFTGTILHFIPRDDIYLEWTGAFIHSPPEGSPEARDSGLQSPLFLGDKFMAQLLALHVLLLCMYKFVSAFFIRNGVDGSGDIKARMFWRPSSLGGAMMVFLFRLFAPAAKSASLDFRWHLMCMAYEAFIIGLYGFM